MARSDDSSSPDTSRAEELPALRPALWPCGPRDTALLALLMVIATFLAYLPAWHGTPLWDDEAHIARPQLHSLSGLARTWIEPGATQQYYPLVYTVFWLEYRLWGGSTLGYHLLNILLHAASAVLVLLILQRLRVPGAWLAATIFALHPIQVESVAWMTELKNTLSGFFFLNSVWAYLLFERTRSRRWWSLAAALFVLGLTAKTAIATLPAALLVLLWWQRGSLSWKSDLRPLLPFFAVGLLAGLFTAHIERKLFGAEGQEFNFSFIERGLIAGRSLWFHLGKLYWPANLAFMYPRWEVSQSVWWQYLYPGTMLLLLVWCWALRRSNRGPLAALLWFAGMLFPALGFFNAYSFRYSFVNDHHQYLACLGMIVLASASLARLLGRWGLWGRGPGHLFCLALVVTLAGLTWRQSCMYTDMETLWRTTIAKNPACWMAHNNLGNVLLQKGQTDEAISQFQAALHLNPDVAEAHSNLGTALGKKGQTNEAINQLEEAIRLEPRYAEAHYNLGTTLMTSGQTDEAISQFQAALRLKPDYADARNNLGIALGKKGQPDEAIRQFREAIRLKPEDAKAHKNLGTALAQKSQTDEAIRQLQEASRLKPDDAEAHNNLGTAFAQKGQINEAIREFQETLRLKPDAAGALNYLGYLWTERGENLEPARAMLAKAVRLEPKNAAFLDSLGWVLFKLHRPGEALDYLLQAVANSARPSAALYDHLGDVYAALYQSDLAAQAWRKALSIGPNQTIQRKLGDSSPP